MGRAPFNVLVFPHRLETGSGLRYAVFHRRDLPGCWQGIAGGGEEGEQPIETARREAHEEAGIPTTDPSLRWTALDSVASVPASAFGAGKLWEPNVYVVAEHSFGVEVRDSELTLSSEHVDYAWLSFPEALSRLTFDSNRVALWELHLRLTGIQPSDPEAVALVASLEQLRIRP
jgi:dATP pyrophosphohydrolase